MQVNSIFYVNSAGGTGQFARLESSSTAILKQHNVIWVSPKVKKPLKDITYLKSFKDIKFNKKERFNIIFSSESDIFKNLSILIPLKIRYPFVRIIFMQRINSLKAYYFVLKKDPSAPQLFKTAFFPIIIVISYFVIDKYIFQTSIEMSRYFFGSKIRSLIMGLFFSSKKSIHVLPNNSGIDWNMHFKRSSKNIALDNNNKQIISIVHIGNVQYFAKGIDTIIEASSHLDKSKYEFKFIGKIPIQFESTIKTIVSENRPNIKFYGHCDDPHIFLENKKSIFVSASRLDNCPNSVLEALSFKVPIIVSDISAHKFIFRDDKFYFKCGDAWDLVKKIRQISNNENILEDNIKSIEAIYRKFDFDWKKNFYNIIKQ